VDSSKVEVSAVGICAAFTFEFLCRLVQSGCCKCSLGFGYIRALLLGLSTTDGGHLPSYLKSTKLNNFAFFIIRKYHFVS
jgi:hypothetical protein